MHLLRNGLFFFGKKNVGDADLRTPTLQNYLKS